MPRLEQLLEFPSHLPHANSVLIALKYHLGEIIAKYLRFQFIKKKKKTQVKERKHTYIHLTCDFAKLWEMGLSRKALLNAPKCPCWFHLIPSPRVF